jgi:hypothetical protein
MGAAMSEYRKKAEECLRAAKRMRDPAERIEMLGIARGYMKLADHAVRSRIDPLQQKGPDQVEWEPADRGEKRSGGDGERDGTET